MILSNQVKCRKCGDEIFSAHRHDFVKCSCRAATVDGGMAYLRRLGNPENMEEMSISIPEVMFDALMVAIDDETRNDLGKLCNIFRVLRRYGFNDWPEREPVFNPDARLGV